jgi:hypothetical protein
LTSAKPAPLNRLRHGSRGLAGADDDQSAAIVGRQIRWHAQRRVGRGNGGVEQAAEAIARGHLAIQPRPASVVVNGLYSQPTQPA